ncbi:GLPGLI family protein [Winogradskyella sp. PC D3.3]
MTEESKVINGYTCYLATIDKLNDKKVKAWYTPDIPVKHGPRGFNGLSGLIMEIEDVILQWTVVKNRF